MRKLLLFRFILHVAAVALYTAYGFFVFLYVKIAVNVNGKFERKKKVENGVNTACTWKKKSR